MNLKDEVKMFALLLCAKENNLNFDGFQGSCVRGSMLLFSRISRTILQSSRQNTMEPVEGGTQFCRGKRKETELRAEEGGWSTALAQVGLFY